MKRLAIILALLLASPASAETFSGLVTSVTDGDTFRIGSVRVRIWGIDAPERNEAGAGAATRALTALAAGREVTCRLRDIDRYGRAVGQCFVSGRDVAAELVSTYGVARDWPKYSGGYYVRC